MQGKKSIVVANAPMSFVQNIIPKFLHSYLSKESSNDLGFLSLNTVLGMNHNHRYYTG